MSRDKKEKRESEQYPTELESQFIIRMPDEPGKVLGDLIKSGDSLKNRFKIQINDDLRHGEVRLDHWLLQAKVVDLPTLVESWKTIDRKSLYKSADICQMMICKDKFDEIVEDESIKNKKKDPLKVDKKFLWPHGVTPPTKNVRKRRFRKTLKKKCAEAPEIEKEVKRLLRADNEALSYTWEVIGEDEWNAPKSESTESHPHTSKGKKDGLINLSSKEEDIFGGALSDSEGEDESAKVEDRKLSRHNAKLASHQTSGIKPKKTHMAQEVKSEMLERTKSQSTSDKGLSYDNDSNSYSPSDVTRDHHASSSGTSHTSIKLQELFAELEELKQRRQRTQLEILNMENMTLKQRFQDLLKSLNRDIGLKELQYYKLQSNH